MEWKLHGKIHSNKLICLHIRATSFVVRCTILTQICICTCPKACVSASVKRPFTGPTPPLSPYTFPNLALLQSTSEVSEWEGVRGCQVGQGGAAPPWLHSPCSWHLPSSIAPQHLAKATAILQDRACSHTDSTKQPLAEESTGQPEHKGTSTHILPRH